MENTGFGLDLVELGPTHSRKCFAGRKPTSPAKEILNGTINKVCIMGLATFAFLPFAVLPFASRLLLLDFCLSNPIAAV